MALSLHSAFAILLLCHVRHCRLSSRRVCCFFRVSKGSDALSLQHVQRPTNTSCTPRLVMSLRWYNRTRRCIRLFYQQGNSFIQLMRDTLTAMDAWMHLDGDDDGDRNTAHRTYLMANGRLSDRRADQ